MRILLFTVLPGVLLGQNIQVTPSNPAVNAGSSVTIKTDRPVRFSLQGSGTLTATSGVSTTYVAPRSVTPQHTLDGCMVLPSDSVFNTRIDTLPVHPESATWTASALTAPVATTYNWGTNVVDHTTPTAQFDFVYTQGLDGSTFPAPPLYGRKRETGSYTTDGNNDHHVVMLNHENCNFYELYYDRPPSNGTVLATSGVTYASATYMQPVNGTTDAASMPLTPLVLHLSEIKAGSVKHAVRFSACPTCVSPDYVWPAMFSTGKQAGAAPMGTRFRLKGSFDISNFPRYAQVVLTGLKQYGMVIADLGFSGEITSSTDITEDAEVTRELQTIANAKIPASDFEVVDESSLMLSSALNVINPNNGYVQPANQALLTITDAANAANQAVIPIAVQTGVGRHARSRNRRPERNRAFSAAALGE